MAIGYRSVADMAIQSTRTNVPDALTVYSQTITSDDTAQALDHKGRVLMARLYASPTNGSPVYIGGSNVTSALYTSKVTADQYADITIDRLEKIYIYGKSADTLMVTYFQGGDA